MNRCSDFQDLLPDPGIPMVRQFSQPLFCHGTEAGGEEMAGKVAGPFNLQLDSQKACLCKPFSSKERKVLIFLLLGNLKALPEARCRLRSPALAPSHEGGHEIDQGERVVGQNCAEILEGTFEFLHGGSIFMEMIEDERSQYVHSLQFPDGPSLRGETPNG